MSRASQREPSHRLLVVMPTWLGDTVMATPTLRALRRLYPQAQISALVREQVKPILDGCPWMDRMITIRTPRQGMADGRRKGLLTLARRLATGKFDTAVLLPNSFRTALMVYLARIPRRVGYDRDGRGGMLTDGLSPLRSKGGFVPVPTRDYYLGLARYLGAVKPDPTMQLFTRPQDDERAVRLLKQAGFDPHGERPLVLLNPGANYGDAKMWPAQRFAAVAERCVRQMNAVVAISGAPRERMILDQVMAATRQPMIDLPRLGVDLRTLKSVVRMSRLMITNDTGPRHMAAAMGVPVITIFGPTDPAWTHIGFEDERQVMVKVFCGPCQKKKCPLDHRCMTQIEPDMVMQRVEELLSRKPIQQVGSQGSGL